MQTETERVILTLIGEASSQVGGAVRECGTPDWYQVEMRVNNALDSLKLLPALLQLLVK